MPRCPSASCAARGRLQGEGPSCPDGCRAAPPASAAVAQERRPATAAAAADAPWLLLVASPRRLLRERGQGHALQCTARDAWRAACMLHDCGASTTMVQRMVHETSDAP